MKLVDEFFDFETKNKLFDIKDKRGFVPWDTIRYFVFYQIYWARLGVKNIQNPRHKSVWFNFRRFFNFISYLLSHRKCNKMFLLYSRDKQNDEYYDKNINDLYNLSDKNSIFCIETFLDNWMHPNYAYKESCTTIIVSIILRLLNCAHYSQIIDETIKKGFPDISLCYDEFHVEYRIFLSYYYFYNFLFKFCKIKKVYMTLNGIQKGLFAAAKKNNIPVYELQHGQISRNHAAYSYPVCVTDNQIYHPDYLLTFGDFWNKGYNYPGVRKIAFGNNSYAGVNVDMSHPNPLNKSILVISNHLVGEYLADCVLNILKQDDGFVFYFKLHPQEYEDKNKYENIFHQYENVSVITNEESINGLLCRSEFLFLTDSTVELEALRMGRKVVIIRKYSYDVMDYVFDEKGIYFIDDSSEFVECYNAHKNEKLEPRKDIFSAFDKDMALKILSFPNGQSNIEV